MQPSGARTVAPGGFGAGLGSASICGVADDLPSLIVADCTAWRGWLGKHHDRSEGVWLLLAKKGAHQPTSLTYDQALNEALCHGWIDGQVRGGDEHSYTQRFTPRRARSRWSRRDVPSVGRVVGGGQADGSG